MINQDAYLKTCKQIGIDPNGMSASGVAYVWKCAEMAMLQEQQQQQAALLKADHNTTVVKVNWPEAPAGKSEDISRGEMQYLTGRIRMIITDIAAEENRLKEIERLLWNECDPKNPQTDIMFSSLNRVRNRRRQFKAERMKLVALQTKMKRKLSRPA